MSHNLKVSMSNRSLVYRNLALGLLAGSAVIALSACEQAGQLSRNIFGDGREPQNVAGARRAPMMNPRAAAAAVPGAQPIVPVASAPVDAPAPARAASADSSPFDYYDESGKPAPVKAPAKAAASAQDDNFFTRLFNGDQSAAPADHAPRKAFSGNPSVSKDTVPVAPIPPAPSVEKPEASAVQADAPKAKPAPAKTASAEHVLKPPPGAVRTPQSQAAPVAAAGGVEFAPSVAPSQDGSWFERVINESFDEDTAKPAAPAAAAAPHAAVPAAPAAKPVAAESEPDMVTGWVQRVFGDQKTESDAKMQGIDPNAKQPALSSVPPKPAEFETIKAARQDKVDEMQTSHDVAQEQKQMLDSEPSQQSAAPVLSAAPLASPPAAVAAPAQAESKAEARREWQQGTSSKADTKSAAPVRAVASEPEAKPVLLQTAPGEEDQAGDQQPVLLGHASASNAPPSVQKSSDNPVPKPANAYKDPGAQAKDVPAEVPTIGLDDVQGAPGEYSLWQDVQAAMAPAPAVAAPAQPSTSLAIPPALATPAANGKAMADAAPVAPADAAPAPAKPAKKPAKKSDKKSKKSDKDAVPADVNPVAPSETDDSYAPMLDNMPAPDFMQDYSNGYAPQP